LQGILVKQPAHIVSAQQFDRPILEEILVCSRQMRELLDQGGDHRLAGKIAATLFYEPSTRTRLSFEIAMLRLGGQVVSTEAAKEFSSAAKGETLEDTVRVVGNYADVIVLRHHQAGAAARAAAVAPVPVIYSELGSLDGKHVVLCGDLKYGRTVHSLARLLNLFYDVTLTFVAPDVVQIPESITEILDTAHVKWSKAARLDEVIGSCDVLYQTRIQKERFTDLGEYEAVKDCTRIDPDLMRLLPEGAIVMHPLPRLDEIDPAIDLDARAAYFRQAGNGVPVRMALLDMVLKP
jgi:aspartate carbamoyltransferase catalytic subunit